MSSESALTTVELGEIGEFKNGANFSQDDYGPGYPIINVKQLFGGRYVDLHGLESLGKQVLKRPEQLFLEPGDILFARSSVKRSGAGQCALVPEGVKETIFSGFIIRFRLNDLSLTNPSFLSYLLQSPEYREIFPRIATGTTISNLSQDALKKIPVRLPTKRNQDQVAAMLGALDDRITLLRETNATLEAIAQALFKSWLVDFDPVRAKLAGRAPEGMDEATAALFPDSFEDSALGLVPRGWSYASLREVVSIFDSKRVPLSGQDRAKRQGPYPYYGAAALMDSVDDYLFDGVYLLTGEDGSVADEQGYPITQYVWGKIWVNNHAHVLQGKDGVSTEHVMLSLRRTNIQPFITGAVQAKLSQANMWRILFMKPSREVSEAFGSMIEPLYARLRQNSEQAQTLATLRDTLLPRLISGQLRLPEAGALIDAA